MNLTKQQIKTIKELIPYFEKVEPQEVSQFRGSSEFYYSESDIKNKFRIDTKKECGVCFGVHLASFYNIISKDYDDGNKYSYTFIRGQGEFLKRMGVEKCTDDLYDLYDFMDECGAFDSPFGPDKWRLQPIEVLRNMLKKGA